MQVAFENRVLTVVGRIVVGRGDRSRLVELALQKLDFGEVEAILVLELLRQLEVNKSLLSYQQIRRSSYRFLLSQLLLGLLQLRVRLIDLLSLLVQLQL